LNRVYIILVNWNGWRDTIECLESVFRCDYADFRVIICDNGSTDASLERIREWAEGRLQPALAEESQMHSYSSPPCGKPLEFIEYQREAAETGGDRAADPPLVLIRNGANLGFAGGNNVGMRYALSRSDFSHVWLLNNDTVIDNHALTAMVRRMQEKTTAGMCGSTLLYYEETNRVQALGGGWYCKWIGLPWHQGRLQKAADSINRDRVEKWMNYVVGASLLVSREFLENIGLMCEDYFLYFEEADWAIRAKGKYTLAYAPESVVYHKVGGSIGTSSNPLQKSYNCDYYNIRNRLYFTRRFFPYALPTIYLVLIGTLAVRILFGRWQRVAMILKLLVRFDVTKPESISASS